MSPGQATRTAERTKAGFDERALKYGADEAEAVIENVREFNVNVRIRVSFLALPVERASF